MLTFERFSGLDNQHPSAELTQDPKTGVCALARAMNVDLDLEGRPRRRTGYVQAQSGAWHSVWQGSVLTFGVKDGDLVNIDSAAVIAAGVSATWYLELPDGRVAFSDGTTRGITDGTAEGTSAWGVALPTSTGTVETSAGDLFAGRYQYALTFVRISDGLEGGAVYGEAFDLAEGDGAIAWSDLPEPPDGHHTNIYLSTHNGDTLYFAATTETTTASFEGANDDLQLPLKTANCYPALAGTHLAFWRGRTLMAVGNVLVASRAHQWELFELSRDVKAMPANLTMIAPVDAGIWIGTEGELAFLRGNTFDDLAVDHERVPGAVAAGSGVMVDGQLLGNGEHRGPAAVCISGGYLTACYSDGTFDVLSDQVYRTDATQFVAAFRMSGEIPQYIAIEQ